MQLSSARVMIMGDTGQDPRGSGRSSIDEGLLVQVPVATRQTAGVLLYLCLCQAWAQGASLRPAPRCLELASPQALTAPGQVLV